MKELITQLLGCLILAALLGPLVVAACKMASASSIRSLKRAFGLTGGTVRVNAITDGIHETGVVTKKADAALSTRHLLVKVGSDADHIAVAGAADIPLGPCIDEPSAAEEVASVRLLGAVKGTVLMVASEAMATTQVEVYAAASGKVALNGVVKVGRLRSTASADGDLIEVEPCTPVVSPNGSTTKAGGTLAVPITRRYVAMTTGGVEALTLADGLPGQEIDLVLATDGGDGTLTPATCSGFATIVFADAGDRATLRYVNDSVGWVIVGTSGVSAPPATTV